MKEQLEEVRVQFEPYSEQVDMAEKELQAEEPEDAWDNVAPNTQHQESKDKEANELNDDGQPPQQHDIGVDLGLATHEEEKLQSNHEMTDIKYRNRMQ